MFVALSQELLRLPLAALGRYGVLQSWLMVASTDWVFFCFFFFLFVFLVFDEGKKRGGWGRQTNLI